MPLPRTLRTALLLVLPPVTAIAAPPPVPVYKEFGDWVVACDNVRTCTAHAVPDLRGRSNAAEAQGDASLWITRDAGPTGTWQLRYVGEHPGRPEAVTVDGQTMPEAVPWAVAGTGDHPATLAGPPAAALLGRMKDATKLVLSLTGEQATFSLTGLAAALLLSDDVQGRVGTVTALARPGPGAANSVPAAPSLPVVHAASVPPALTGAKALAAAVRRSRAAVLKAHGCDADVADGDVAEPLDAGSALVLLVCNRAAYQEDSLPFRVPRSAPGQAQLLRLPRLPGETRAATTGSDADLLTGGSYDPAKAELNEFARGRGIADCGLSRTWTFDGHAFQPSAYAFQDRCGGQPGDWPVLFRTRAVR